MPQGGMHDALPQEEKRHGFLLVFPNDVCPPHLYGAPHHWIQLWFEAEEFLQVKTVNPIFREDFGSQAHPVCSHNLFLGIVPKEQVMVVVIKSVKVNGFVGPLPYGPESHFPLSPNFL